MPMAILAGCIRRPEARIGKRVAGVMLALAPVLAPAMAATPPGPTVVVDVHGRGYEAVAALGREPGVLWAAEFGHELLLGVSEEALGRLLARPGVRAGPARLAFDEIVVRERACPLHEPEPALAVIGGWEILRKPPALARAARLAPAVGMPLPADGVVAREVFNRPAGKLAAPVRGDLMAAVARVDAARWYDTMAELAAIDRSSYAATLPVARDRILAHFGVLGLETGSHDFTLPAGLCAGAPAVALQNPWGLKPGEAEDASLIVVGAHYDSRNHQRCDGSQLPQPGANDNASGCAGVIELARVFARVPTAHAILFVCFAGEEQGLQGSFRFVDWLAQTGQLGRVAHMINLDMIGHAVDSRLDARVETTAAHAAWLDLYSAMASTYAPELNLILSTATQPYSDHWPFLQAGIPAFFTWENGASIYSHWHQVSDLPENMGYARELAGGILRMDAAVVGELAGSRAIFFGGFEGGR
jgi:hypothetical protein